MEKVNKSHLSDQERNANYSRDSVPSFVTLTSQTSIGGMCFNDIPFIDLPEETPRLRLLRKDMGHSSLKSEAARHSKHRLCRRFSDSGTNFVRQDFVEPKKPCNTRTPSRRACRRVRRCVSAVEDNDKNRTSREKAKVRRSVSERSGTAGKTNLLVPPPGLRPGSTGSYISDGNSSRCSKASSAKTLASNASISEVMAVELGIKDIPGLTTKEARRRRVVCTVALIAVTILAVSVLLVALTLFLSPEIDAVLRKENEEIYRAMSSGGSTPMPATDGVPGNDTSATPDGQPG